MNRQETTGFTKFELLMGIAVMAVAALALPWLNSELQPSKVDAAQSQASEIAQAVLDYHTEMGSWPAMRGHPIDLAVLATEPGAQVAMGSLLPGNVEAWLDKVPLDSWGKPYLAVVYDQRAANVTAAAAGPAPGDRAASPTHFPTTPPDGVVIVVVSSGPDGRLQTEPGVLTERATPVFDGDDVGFVLR